MYGCYSLILLILKSIQKFGNEGSKAIMIVPKWKGQMWSMLMESFTIFRMKIRNPEDILKHGKKKHVSFP
jgi:hypothetical protein